MLYLVIIVYFCGRRNLRRLQAWPGGSTNGKELGMFLTPRKSRVGIHLSVPIRQHDSKYFDRTLTSEAIMAGAQIQIA
jgi:hypothetical protein